MPLRRRWYHYIATIQGVGAAAAGKGVIPPRRNVINSALPFSGPRPAVVIGGAGIGFVIIRAGLPRAAVAASAVKAPRRLRQNQII